MELLIHVTHDLLHGIEYVTQVAPAYRSRNVLHLAQTYQISELIYRAREALSAVVENEDFGDHDWADEMPTWRTRTKARGLLGWGETRKGCAEGTIVQTKGAITVICRAPMMKSLDYYFSTIGLPPVIAGESRRKAIAAGRYFPQPGDSQKKRGLIPLQPPHKPMNLLNQFLLVVASAYNLYLDPEVEDGTDASLAVLGFLSTPSVTRKLLTFMKNRYLKLGNKKHLSKCAKGLNKWVRAGDWDIRVEALRTCGRDLDSVDLKETKDPCDSGADLFKSLAYEVTHPLSHCTQQLIHVTHPLSYCTQQMIHVTHPLLHVTQQIIHCTQHSIYITHGFRHCIQHVIHVTQRL